MTGADRGTGANNSSEAATTITPGSNFTTGSTGILCFHCDNAVNNATNTPTSITDSAGNVWYRRASAPVSSAGANTGVETAIYTGLLTNGLTTSGSIVLTYTTSNVTAKAWTLTEAAPSTAGNICITKTGSTNSTQAASTGQSVTSGFLIPGEMVIGTNGAESADTYTGDSDTTNGSWSTKQSAGAGSGATGMSTISQYKIQTTATSTQSYDPTLTSADNASATIMLAEVPPKVKFLSGTGGASEATSTYSMQLPLAAGSLCVLCWAGDNTNPTGPGAVGNLPATLTDSQSNTWTLRQNAAYDPGASAAGVELGIYTSVLATGLAATGDSVPITYVGANVISKIAVILEFTDASAYSAGGVGSGSTTGSPTITTASIPDGHYVVAVVGAEATTSFVEFTADTDTTNGSWSSQLQAINNALGATGMTLQLQYKKVTATGTQTHNPTLASADLIDGYVDLTSPSASTVHTYDFFPFFN